MKLYTIAGHNWRPIQISTLGHDLFMAQQLFEGKLDGFRLGADEQMDAFALRMLRAILASGKLFLLLGGLLLPEQVPDEKWSEDLARESAAVFAGVTSDEDKAVLQECLKPLLLSFFVAGMDSSGPSAAASKAHPGPAPVPPANAPSNPIAATSGNGARSSVPWWARIFGGRRKPAAGSSVNV